MSERNKILAGTTSEQKLVILRKAIASISNSEILSFNVSSGITEQPIDEPTTIQGSINRAKSSILAYGHNDFTFAIGLEAGLAEIDGRYHLVCVASIVENDERVYTGISSKLPLPKVVSDQVKSGQEFGKAIREFKATMGAVSNVETQTVNDLVNRESLFAEAVEQVLLLRTAKKFN